MNAQVTELATEVQNRFQMAIYPTPPPLLPQPPNNKKIRYESTHFDPPK